MNTNHDFDCEVAALAKHMQTRGLASYEFASVCAAAAGCVIDIECSGNTEKAYALGSLIRTARHWADMPEAH